MIEHFRCD